MAPEVALVDLALNVLGYGPRKPITHGQHCSHGSAHHFIVGVRVLGRLHLQVWSSVQRIDDRLDWLLNRLLEWLLDWLLDWLIDWLLDWLLGWLLHWCYWPVVTLRLGASRELRCVVGGVAEQVGPDRSGWWWYRVRAGALRIGAGAGVLCSSRFASSNPT